jgi:hypothetical protein
MLKPGTVASATDVRRGFDGLAAVVQQTFESVAERIRGFTQV